MFFLEHKKNSIRQMRHRVHVEDMVSELVDGVPYFAIHFSVSAKHRCVFFHFVFSAQLERNHELHTCVVRV